MRPKGKHKTETDVLAVKAGVNAIAFPPEQARPNEFITPEQYLNGIKLFATIYNNYAS